MIFVLCWQLAGWRLMHTSLSQGRIQWSKQAVIGYLLIVFLKKVLVSLTQFFCEKPAVKNLKVLKKYLMNLTLTIVYHSFRYRIRIISNFSPELRPILGDFVRKYGNLEAPNRW